MSWAVCCSIGCPLTRGKRNWHQMPSRTESPRTGKRWWKWAVRSSRETIMMRMTCSILDQARTRCRSSGRQACGSASKKNGVSQTATSHPELTKQCQEITCRRADRPWKTKTTTKYFRVASKWRRNKTGTRSSNNSSEIKVQSRSKSRITKRRCQIF